MSRLLMGGSIVETLDGENQKILKFPTEGLVQQRLLKRLQRGVLPLVEAGEALGFFAEGVELGRDLFLLGPTSFSTPSPQSWP